MSAHQPEAAIFAALQLVGDERAAYLDRAGAGDAELRQRLEARLAVQAQAPTAAEEPAAPARPNPTIRLKFEAESEISERIGRYKLLQKIGEGGCGVVYLAEQEEPVRRRVALKVIKPGMDTKQVLARFGAERQALLTDEAAKKDYTTRLKLYKANTPRLLRTISRRSSVCQQLFSVTELFELLCPPNFLPPVSR